MSYKLYRQLKLAQNNLKNETFNTDGKNITNDVVFGNIVTCFNIIADTVRYNKGLPYFNLKENWVLIKSQDFETALNNIDCWLQKVDDRYDGETWTEKVQEPTTHKKTLITGEEELQKFYDILTDDDISATPIYNDNDTTGVMLQDVEFEIDDEDYDRIYFGIYKYGGDYDYNLRKVLINVLNEAGVTDFKINIMAGDIKFYK